MTPSGESISFGSFLGLLCLYLGEKMLTDLEIWNRLEWSKVPG